jgi:hypothetical protein
MTRDGKLGLMPVYRNDPGTELDEGAEVNDEITLLVADLGSISGIRWTGLGDVVNLKDEGVFVEAVPEQLPKRYALYQNFPNPFNPTTTIRYDLAKFSSVRLAIFNVQGERIRNLVDKMQPPGRYAVQWDGRSSSGEFVSSGIYFYKLDAGGFVRTKKMLLLK